MASEGIFLLSFGLGLSLPLVLGSLGVEMVVYLRVVRSVWYLFMPCMFLGVGVLRPCLLLSLLLASAAQIGFAWDGESRVGLGFHCLLSGCLLARFSTFAPLSCRLGISKLPLDLLREKVFGRFSLLILKALYNYLSLLT